MLNLQLRLRADRRLRYASSPIGAIVPIQRTGEQHQDVEICNPCPPTFLLPISPAAHFAHEREPLWMVDRLNGNIDVEVWPIYSLFATAAVRVRLDHDQHEGDDQHGQRKNRCPDHQRSSSSRILR